MIARYLTGFRYVIRGFQVAKTLPNIWIWILIPFLIDCVILFSGASLGFGLVQAAAASAVGWIFGGAPSGYADLVYYPILAFLTVGFVAILIYATYLLASVIASPFYSIIAERVLIQNGVIQDLPFDLKRMLRSSAGMFWVSIKRAMLLIGIGLFLFVLTFIPGANLLAAYCAFTILAIDSAEFSFEARQMKLSDRIATVREKFPEFLGMGGFIALTALVPGLILLAMPFAVIGAAETLYPKVKK